MARGFRAFKNDDFQELLQPQARDARKEQVAFVPKTWELDFSQKIRGWVFPLGSSCLSLVLLSASCLPQVGPMGVRHRLDLGIGFGRFV